MKTSSRRNVIRYLLVTGAVSGLLFGLVVLLNAAKAPTFLLRIAESLSAWSPTIAVWVLFRVLFPGQKLGAYLKRNFSLRVKPLTFILLLCIQTGIYALAIAAYVWRSGSGVKSLIWVSFPQVMVLLVSQLTSGATGEELGWRGYLLNELQKRRSIFASALLVGIIWGLWHFPVWFTLGYTSIDLIRYIVFFLVQIISLSVVIAVFYSRHKNLLIPIWIHFLTNFLVGLVKIDLINLIGWMALGYAVWAIILLAVERKSVFEVKREVSQEVVR